MRFCFVDIGASRGISQRWKLLGSQFFSIGFEPNALEFSRLNPSHSAVWINSAVSGRDEQVVLNLTKAFQNSSLLQPNRDVLRHLNWGDGHDILERIEVSARSLDSVLAERKLSADFVKIDTQGTELDILQGAQNQLKDSIIGLEVEISFQEVYSKQGLFIEVDSFLRSKGFEIWDIGNILRMKPPRQNIKFGSRGRIVSADAIYFKRPALLSNQELMMKFCMALAVYGYFEEAYHYISLSKFKQTEQMQKEIRKLQQRVRSIYPCWNIPFLSKFAKKLSRIFESHGPSNWDVGLGNM